MQAITSTVIHGKGLGHTIGFPTANMVCDSQILQAGTRRYNVVYNDKIYQAIGPYFPDQQLLEAHLLGFDGDLYGQQLTIYPLYNIRENQKFNNLDELTVQIQQDKQRVLDQPIKVMTFGTFDHVHPGHESYLSQARRRGDQLITVIARDETVEKVKHKTPDHDELTRQAQIQATGLVDHVILGNLMNHYQCLLDFQPQVICLGYDQHSFDEGINDFYTSQGRPLPSIIRLDSFHPDKYKSSYFSSS